MDKTIIFRIVGRNINYQVGQQIIIDGVEGKVISIRSIKRIGRDGEYELIGRYKPKSNYVDQLLNQLGRNK
ncbi:hypothetical protein CN446_14920 [Bacillus cereus]|nr:hypothetical protein CN446_14920 [Bacillus cereus]